MMYDGGERLRSLLTRRDTRPSVPAFPCDVSLLKVATGEPLTHRVAASDLPELFPPGERNTFPAGRLIVIHTYFSPRHPDGDHIGQVPGGSLLADSIRGDRAPLVREGKLLGIFSGRATGQLRFSGADRSFIELFAAWSPRPS